MKKKYAITGKVLEATSRIPVPGLRVEAWDKDLIFDDLVGSSVTNENGEFSFSFDDKYFRELFLDRRPDLFFRVFFNDTLVLDTQEQVLWNLMDKTKSIELLVAGSAVGLPGGGTPPPQVPPGMKPDELGKLAGLDKEALAHLAALQIPVSFIGEATLLNLADENKISAAQLRDLRHTLSLTRLTGEHAALTLALKKAAPESVIELVHWDSSLWSDFLVKNKIKLPEGETDAASYAENLRNVMELSFPSEYFLHRVINNDAGKTAASHYTTVVPLLAKNPELFTGSSATAAIDWTGISAKDQQQIETGLATLQPLVNTYRGLGIGALLQTRDAKPAEIQKAVESRFASLQAFYTNNPTVNLETADFTSASDRWNWNAVPDSDKVHVKRQMAATQRAFIMGGNYDTGNLLMKKGYHSAGNVAAMQEDEFIRTSGLGRETGKKVYAKATKMASASSHYFEAIRDITRGDFRHIALSNQDTNLVNDLKQIDGYAELFGNQDFCECEACKSVLSPAAYFTDLMYFVQEHVSKKAFLPGNSTHPLYLRRRRPDLWTLKLSCANTTTEIPYLQVVNEVLENYLIHEIPSNDVYELLRTSGWSVRQPFNLLLEETRLFLSHFGLNLAGVYESLRLPVAEQYREFLLLSTEELGLITVPDTAGAHKRFGNKPLNDFDVQEFIRLAGITRSELDELLAAQFDPSFAGVAVKMIKVGLDIQQYREVLTGLTAQGLDGIHRYLRLQKKTKWTIREFDFILVAMKSAGLLTSLGGVDGGGMLQVLQLALVKSLQERFGFTPEELATLVYRLPMTAIADNQKPLYNRLFDLEKIFGTANVTAASTATLPADSANDKITPLILAGLGITQSEFGMLLKLLGVDTSVDQVIGIDLISALYRHALLARGLQLSVEDFVNLLQLLPGAGPVTAPAQTTPLAELASWFRTAPLSIAEVLLIVKGSESSGRQFTATVNTVAAAVIEIQTAALADKKEKTDLLFAYLQRTYNLTADQLSNTFFPSMLSYNMAAPEIAKALNATFTNGKPDVPADLDGLLTIMRELERYTLLFSKAAPDAALVAFVTENKNAFGITDLKALTVTHIRNMVRYHLLPDQQEEFRDAVNKMIQQVQAGGTFTAADNKTLADTWKQPESLIASLTTSLPLTLPAMEAIGFIADNLAHCIMLGIQGDALVKLHPADLAGLQAARNIVVGAFASKYPDEKVRNEKSETYNDKLNTLKRDALCDYIISRSDKFKFKDRNDLYHFFLLDVEMSGCFRTSYLVAAITSLQHYIHRCLINLEQSDLHLNPDIADIKVLPGWIPADEWAWRKNYRVWEANRKVFLYPENYIDPTLRDNKSELFKELEDELLQQKITADTAEQAYKKYLAAFSELTRLRYAGAYYNGVPGGFGLFDMAHSLGAQGNGFFLISGITLTGESDESFFYLFARTNVHPYRYSYRTYNHYKQIWTTWKTIDLAIEANEISPVVYRGKLYIYWTESQGKEVNKIKDGNSQADGFVFKSYIKYSMLDENGKWSAPQRLFAGQNHVSEETVFRRVWNGNYPGAGVREKTHDTTVEKFQELVYRKPYAVRTGHKSYPIATHHIWSMYKTISKVTYTTADVSIKFEDDFSEFSVHIPSKTFVVINDDFGNLTLTVKIRIEALFFNYSAQYETPIQLNSCNSVYVHIEVLGISVSAHVPFAKDELNTPVYTTHSDISLSRNTIINLKQNDLLDNAPHISTAPGLQREYLTSYTENNLTEFFVENGKKSLSKHFISQTIQNESNLAVSKFAADSYDNVVLSTILTDDLNDILYADGLEKFLALQTQQLHDNNGRTFDFSGPYGDYYWELFFHIPFLIADHLNANQKFKEAKWWYERIFDPTAGETPDVVKKTDHNWQFREFRNLDIQKLKDMLSDNKALEAYKEDPFNPHAIARLRISAYQKTIVMHYIDNLLDWGDYLFTQDTRESINEAEMLYQLAYDILGRKPVRVGKCDTPNENSLTYEKLAPKIGEGSEFLIQLENYAHVQQQYSKQKAYARVSKSIDARITQEKNAPESLAAIGQKAAMTMETVFNKLKQGNPPVSAGLVANAVNVQQKTNYSSRVKNYSYVMSAKKEMTESAMQFTDADRYLFSEAGNFVVSPSKRIPGMELVKQYTLAFCVPPNSDLMKYWDRVEDRLFKIRNCMNIKGIRRSLSLFQPPIDPMLLVRARAAGLSLEDIVAMINNSGQMPAYRFTYLLEKAKQFTQSVQGFGSALLSALEKKDGEELTLLRSVHEKNILKLTKTIKRRQVQEAQYQYKVAEAGLQNVQNRVDYYAGLIEGGLIPWEITEQVMKWTSGSIRIGEATMGFLASVFGFLPQIGSPFAMKYGGQELKNGTRSLADATGTLATIADNIAILAGLEASHQRREQDWKQQLKLAQQDLKQQNIQLLASEIRQQIAEHDLLIHEKNIENANELFDFYKNKFTNLGLYNYMAATLNRLYRSAYNIAYELAREAEKAYQHERFDDEIYIQADNWQFDKAGLLAGERLMLQLMEMEKKYISTNFRQPEITQTFSLASLSPLQLLKLRQTGSCEIKIPEIAFEALYPGQFRRIIKSVRITIPCVAGQYTNISALLTLTKGSIEAADGEALTELAVAKNTSISSSSANNDAGIFDFSFRDERYLPFEGAGAISEWRLDLPATLRAFNYDTISDVLLHISYTAEEAVNREQAELNLTTAINTYASSTGLFRLVSLRYEFPEALHKLFSQASQVTDFTLTESHFPFLFSTKTLTISSTQVYLKPKKGNAAVLATPVSSINGAAVTWSPSEDLLLPGGAAATTIKGGTATLNGSPKKTWTLNTGNGGLDKTKVDDILVLIRYTVS